MRAASSVTRNSRSASAGFQRTATRVIPGTVSLSNSSRFALSSGVMPLMPVMLPPGRARLATNPSPMGSESSAMIMGMVLVARFAAHDAGPNAMSTSTLLATSSVASSGRRFNRLHPPPEIKEKCRKRHEHAAGKYEQRENAHLRAFKLQRVARPRTYRARNQYAHTRPALRAF